MDLYLNFILAQQLPTCIDNWTKISIVVKGGQAKTSLTYFLLICNMDFLTRVVWLWQWYNNSTFLYQFFFFRRNFSPVTGILHMHCYVLHKISLFTTTVYVMP